MIAMAVAESSYSERRYSAGATPGVSRRRAYSYVVRCRSVLLIGFLLTDQGGRRGCTHAVL